MTGSGFTMTVKVVPTKTGRHDWNSDYVRQMWLPVIGPSSYLLGQLLREAGGEDEAVPVDIGLLTRKIGIHPAAGLRSQPANTLNRIAGFHLGYWDGHQRIEIVDRVQDIGVRHWARFPDWLQADLLPRSAELRSRSPGNRNRSGPRRAGRPSRSSTTAAPKEPSSSRRRSGCASPDR